MANNVYVGNRYVPIFANPVEWDSLRTYEPLTIVTYNGTSYTSRQNVPAGIQLSDSNYWVVTGNYNEQVEMYRREVEEYADSVEEVQSNLTSESTTRANADYMLGGGDLLCIGDSYLKGSTPTSEIIKSWGDYLADFMGKTKNVDYFKYAYGGAGFVNTVDGHNFISLLNDAHNSIQNPNKVGTIVVLGGRNDGTSANLLPNIRTFMTNARNYFPKAKIYYTYGSAFVYDPPRTILYGSEQYERANMDGAIYMGNCSKYFSAYKNAYYDSEGAHPTPQGQKMLGCRIFGAINGEGFPSINRDNLSLTGEGYYINRISNDVYTLASYSRQERTLNVENFNANGQTLAFSRSFEDDNNFYFNRTSENYFTTTAPCVMQIGGSSGKYYLGECIIRLNGKTLEFYPLAVNETNSGHVTGTLTKLFVHPFEIQIPVCII